MSVMPNDARAGVGITFISFMEYFHCEYNSIMDLQTLPQDSRSGSYILSLWICLQRVSRIIRRISLIDALFGSLIK